VDRVIRSSFKHRDSLRAISREDLLKQSCVGVGTALASAARRRFRNAYNLTAMSIAPAEIAVEIREHVREVSIDYHVDAVRQSKTQIVGRKVPWYTKCEFACPLTEDRASHSPGGFDPLGSCSRGRATTCRRHDSAYCSPCSHSCWPMQQLNHLLR
jgi:hypothetical protein